MSDTILTLINDDPQLLVLLIREVYNKGLDDGANMQAADAYHIFTGWDFITNSLDKEFSSIEDFVDYLFNEEENYYETTY